MSHDNLAFITLCLYCRRRLMIILSSWLTCYGQFLFELHSPFCVFFFKYIPATPQALGCPQLPMTITTFSIIYGLFTRHFYHYKELMMLIW